MKHVSRIGEGLKLVTDIPELGPNTLTICLHDNLLRSLAPLSAFTRLVDLNVSLNQLASTEGLLGLSRLTSLNLSSNLLQHCDNLSGLSSLKSLQLQQNHIISLGTLKNLTKTATCLAYLDLRGNRFNPGYERHTLETFSGVATLLLDEHTEEPRIWSQKKYHWNKADVSLNPKALEARCVKFRIFTRLSLAQRTLSIIAASDLLKYGA